MSSTSQRIVIVGGGVSGLSIAVRLSQAGLPVTVLEASHLGAVASTRNQGWLYSGGTFALDEIEVARMCHQSLQQTLAFCPECVEPDHDAMAYVFSDAETDVTAWTSAWSEAGIAYSNLPVAALLAEMPALAPSEIQRAFALPDRAIRSEVLLARLAAAAENAGAEIRTETPAVELVRKDRRVAAVVTGTGETIAAELVILAENASETLTLPEPDEPADDEEAVVRQSEITPMPLKSHLIAVQPGISRRPFYILDAEGFNHVPHAPASVFGMNRWLPVTKTKDVAVVDSEIERLWSLVGRFLPQLNRDDFETKEWAGTTVQAMYADQVDPGRAPRPAVIDYQAEPLRIDNLLSVYPGRATMWPFLAEETRKLVLDRVGARPKTVAKPPWTG